MNALQDKQFHSHHPEDEAICQQYRHHLEKNYAISFAPATLARQFSYERNKLETITPFGFHGLFNLHHHLNGAETKTVLNSLNKATYNNPEMLELFLALWKKGDTDNAKCILDKISKTNELRPEVDYLKQQITQRNALRSIEQVLQASQTEPPDSALKLLSLAMLMDHKNPEVFNATGKLLVRHEQFEQAKTYFQQAVRLESDENIYQQYFTEVTGFSSAKQIKTK